MSIIIQQHIHSAKAFSLSHSALLGGRLGLHKHLGGDTAGRAVCLYGTVLSNKSWEKEEGGDISVYGICLPK